MDKWVRIHPEEYNWIKLLLQFRKKKKRVPNVTKVYQLLVLPSPPYTHPPKTASTWCGPGLGKPLMDAQGNAKCRIKLSRTRIPSGCDGCLRWWKWLSVHRSAHPFPFVNILKNTEGKGIFSQCCPLNPKYATVVVSIRMTLIISCIWVLGH